jgi:voltage-gated potassium channel
VALLYGTVGYRVIEGFNVIDSLYMTVITLSTVGFSEVHPLSEAGRVFTITVIVLGVVAFFDFIAVFTPLLAGGQFSRFLQGRAMQKRIDGLSGHYVVCAYGRVGRAAVEELSQQDAPVVIVESRAELEPLLVETGLPYVLGDSTQKEVLTEAGVGRARALVCAVDSDAVNVYITLTARALNPGLFIISRASSPQSVDNLVRAGSDRVVSPYNLSGVRMARMALQPAMLEFADMVAMSADLRIEELLVVATSALASHTVRDICAPHPGVMVLAVKSSDGELVVPPRADTVITGGDLMIVVGPAEPLSQLARQAS